MADVSHPGKDELARQARQHLASLKAAGVQWLPARPAAPPIADQPARAPRLVEEESAGVEAAALQTSLPLLEEGVKGLTIEQRRAELKHLAERVADCRRCPQLASTRRQTVFGAGPVDAELCFIGEAPGADEDAQGEPFVGAAGQLLNRIIAACGMKREDVFICNILRCRPPGNRKPAADEVANCREYLDRTLELVRPRFICCLGATAAQNLLGTTESIGRMRGRFLEYHGIPVLCTYHPSYLLRIPEPAKQTQAKRDVWEDMKKLLARMGRSIPPPKKEG